MLTNKLISPIVRFDESGEQLPAKISAGNKQYLLLLFFKDGTKTFEMITGRSEARDYIIENINDIVLVANDETKASHILVESALLSEAVPITEFMQLMKKYFNDGFDIEEFIQDEEEEYRQAFSTTELTSSINALIDEDTESQDI